MVIKSYAPNEISNLLYKVLFAVEAIYVKGVTEGTFEPNLELYYECDLIDAFLKLEKEKDDYKQACKEGLPYRDINEKVWNVYQAFYQVLNLYEKEPAISNRIANIKKKINIVNSSFEVSDDMYSYYQNKTAYSDRQVLYQVLGNRILMNSKKENKPYALGFNNATKYEMGKYFFLNKTCNDGFDYTIKGFLTDDKHIKELREIVITNNPVKENEEVER